MDEQVTIGELYRRAHVQEQLEPCPDAEIVLARETVEGHAVDILHDQIGTAVAGRAALVEAGDRRVLEATSASAVASPWTPR